MSVSHVRMCSRSQWPAGLKSGIVFTAYQRPDYLRETLDSWSHVRGIHELSTTIFLEPSPRQDDMLNVIASAKINTAVVLNQKRLGVLVNPWHALDYGFNRYDFVILAEEDIVVSSDILEYFAYVVSTVSYRDTLGVCSYSENATGNPEVLFREEQFRVLVWGTWRYWWNLLFRERWDKDYSTNSGEPMVQSGWDWHMTRLAHEWQLPFVHPEVSRSKHIGEFGGAHTTPETQVTLQARTFQQHRNPSKYRWKQVS